MEIRVFGSLDILNAEQSKAILTAYVDLFKNQGLQPHQYEGID